MTRRAGGRTDRGPARAVVAVTLAVAFLSLVLPSLGLRSAGASTGAPTAPTTPPATTTPQTTAPPATTSPPTQPSTLPASTVPPTVAPTAPPTSGYQPPATNYQPQPTAAYQPPVTAAPTLTTTQNLLVGPPPSTTSTTTPSSKGPVAKVSGSSRASSDPKVWSIVAALVAVALVLGFVTFRYWRATRPELALASAGTAGAPTDDEPRKGGKGRGRGRSRYSDLVITVPKQH